MTKYKTTPREKTIIKLMEMVIDTLKYCDDLTGSVVLLERSNNYAVVSTHIDDYEIMTVECFLSDLQVA